MDNGHTKASQRLCDVFISINLAFFQPRKDQCDICVGHQIKNVTEKGFQKHIAKKTQAKVEKETETWHLHQMIQLY